MSHANARLTPAGRLIMVQRIGSGRAVAHVTAERGSPARPRGGGGVGSGSTAQRGWWVAPPRPRAVPCEDNAFAYRHSAAFKAVIDTHAIKQRFIKPHCPWTNGKVERLNRTLATEWAYARPWTSNDDRRAGLTTWLDHYNLDRAHLGIGGKTPIDRINNGRGQYTSAPRTRRSPRSRSARAWCRRCWRRPRPSVSRSCRC